MALAMVRPYRHSKTGVYQLRKVVPAELRQAVGKRELKQSLGTKDPKEARANAPAVLAKFEAILEAARAGGDRLTLRDISALCGEWYRSEVATWGDNPDQVGDLDIYEDLLLERVICFEDPAEDDDPALEPILKLRPADLAEADALLKSHRYVADANSVQRLAGALFDMKRKFIAEMRRRLDGDWTPDRTLDKLPALVAREAPEVAPKVTFEGLVAAWAAEAGTAGKALYDREQTAKKLSAFLGHTDARRVTADDVVRWKEARLAAVLPRTVANDIGELRPIWTWGKANRKLAFAENPFAGLAPRQRKGGRRVRGPYTEEEACKLLEAARREKDASLRWLPWVLCFTGARLGEVTQAVKEDVQRETAAGPVFIHIHLEGEGRTLKTPHSERMVPVHPVLAGEGFLRYVEKLPVGSPLFPDLRPDKFGALKGTATKKHGRWVRKTVGITDKTKDPAHAWRHRFEDQARRAGLPQNVTDALLGHLNAMNESESYGRGFRYMPDATAPWVAKMAGPLAARREVASLLLEDG